MLIVSCCVVLVLSTILVGSSPLPHQHCPTCEHQFCPRAEDSCAKGLIPDPCKCCQLGICVLSEGERCLYSEVTRNISSTDLGKYGECGGNLECMLRNDLMPEDVPESICICKNSSPVCGQLNVTYDTICHLEEAGDTLQALEPCSSPPEIMSNSPETIVTETREVVLDCEVKGYPVPSVMWEFQASDGSVMVLPGDDTSISVQSRGGPETYMTTSWVQIFGARLSDSGTYFCVAVNSAGETRVATSVAVHVFEY